jgi:alpha-glucuronidase
MLESREAAVDYMMPLGLHHLFAFEHHYGPEPWEIFRGDVRLDAMVLPQCG